MSEGFEPLKAEKLKAPKLKRIQAVKLLCLPPFVFLTVFKICFNFKAVSVVLREVCLVRIPELCHFCSNQWFLFLVTNVLVIILSCLAGSLAPSTGNDALYDEFVRRSEAARKYHASRPLLGKKQSSSQSTSSRRKNSVELQKRRSLELVETQQQAILSEAKSLTLIEVPCAESATFSAEELQRRSEAKSLIVPCAESATTSAEELQRSEAQSLTVMEVQSAESAIFSDELERRSNEFIAKNKGRFWKEESFAYYQEMAKLICK